jgi:hypothetical protein
MLNRRQLFDRRLYECIKLSVARLVFEVAFQGILTLLMLGIFLSSRIQTTHIERFDGGCIEESLMQGYASGHLGISQYIMLVILYY